MDLRNESNEVVVGLVETFCSLAEELLALSPDFTGLLVANITWMEMSDVF